MGKYDVNFLDLIKSTLPFSLRNALTRIVFVLFIPFRILHSRFMVFRDRKNVNLSYNIQYPNIQRLLNDNFDELERRIIVMDSNQSLLPTVAYLSGEIGKRQLRVPFAVYSWSMWGYRPFWVIVPFEYSGDENKINAIKKTVENYKFAGTQYELKFQ